MSIVGNTYLERGEPVVVLARWRSYAESIHAVGKTAAVDLMAEAAVDFHDARRSGPRNVLIRRADGELVVRPFRGLLKAAKP